MRLRKQSRAQQSLTLENNNADPFRVFPLELIKALVIL